MTRRPSRLAGLLLAGALAGSLAGGLAGGLSGCASAPTAEPHGPVTTYLISAETSPLARIAELAGVPENRSGFRPMLYSHESLQARLSMIRAARSGIDIQTYVLGDDRTGHQLLRALRDAAARGVRVRLLVDDLYTAGLTDLLLGLAAHPNIELRLYNPFASGRDSWALRALDLLGDFGRLNRRMHNKLFIVDGRMAVVGGRNLADAYFMRDEDANFIDFDMLCVGAIGAELSAHFDGFWNSRHAVPIGLLADNRLDPVDRRRSFQALTAPTAAPAPVIEPPMGPSDPLLLPLVQAEAELFVDSPDKTQPPTAGAAPFRPSRSGVFRLTEAARSSLIVVSPYFIPSADGLRMMQAARQRGVEIEVVTNSLVDTDEPLVSLAYGQRRMALLRSGIRLFELSSAKLQRDATLHRVLRGSVGRLHAKLGFVDRRWVLVGSMNMDPRSLATNTELVLAIDSPDLARQVLAPLLPSREGGLYEVRLREDQEGLRWVGPDSDEALDDEPAPPWWQRLKLKLLSWLVPEDLL